MPNAVKVKLRKIIFPIIISIILILGVWLKLPRMMLEPNDMLGVELNQQESSFSDLKVKFLLWNGADASEPLLNPVITGDNSYNFILLSAIRNKRINVIPILEGNYTKEQITLAYKTAGEDLEIQKSLNDLFK